MSAQSGSLLVRPQAKDTRLQPVPFLQDRRLSEHRQIRRNQLPLSGNGADVLYRILFLQTEQIKQYRGRTGL